MKELEDYIRYSLLSDLWASSEGYSVEIEDKEQVSYNIAQEIQAIAIEFAQYSCDRVHNIFMKPQTDEQLFTEFINYKYKS